MSWRKNLWTVWTSLIHPTLQAAKNSGSCRICLFLVSNGLFLFMFVPISLVCKLEQKASVHIRKWLKLHKSIISFSFYSSASPCPLPVRSLTSVLKSSKISGHLLLKHSQDASVSSCVPKLEAGNWQVEEAVQACETDLKHKSIIGHHQHSRHGLGYIKTSKVPSDKSSRDYRTFISSHHKEIEDRYAISKAVQLKV